ILVDDPEVKAKVLAEDGEGGMACYGLLIFSEDGTSTAGEMERIAGEIVGLVKAYQKELEESVEEAQEEKENPPVQQNQAENILQCEDTRRMYENPSTQHNQVENKTSVGATDGRRISLTEL